MESILDIGLVRGLTTAVLLLAFVGVVIWAWSGGRKQTFEQAAQLPLEQEDSTAPLPEQAHYQAHDETIPTDDTNTGAHHDYE